MDKRASVWCCTDDLTVPSFHSLKIWIFTRFVVRLCRLHCATYYCSDIAILFHLRSIPTESKTNLESAQSFSVVLATLYEDILGEKTIDSDGGEEWRKAEINHWGEMDGEDWKRSTTSGLVDKRGRLGGVPRVSVALGRAGLVQTVQVCQCSWDYVSLSYIPAYYFLKENLVHLYLWLPPIWYWSFHTLPMHPCQKAPLLSAVASSSCCSLGMFCSPELLLLFERKGGGQGRSEAFSCVRERAGINEWGEDRQESSGGGLMKLNLEDQHNALLKHRNPLSCVSPKEGPRGFRVSCLSKCWFCLYINLPCTCPHLIELQSPL